jgi:tryptophan 2,3-dioxygenase
VGTTPPDRFEQGVVTGLSSRLTGAQYLHLDELLFIVQRQTSERWLKLVLHELRDAATALAADDLRLALKRLARVKHIQRTRTEQWWSRQSSRGP